MLNSTLILWHKIQIVFKPSDLIFGFVGMVINKEFDDGILFSISSDLNTNTAYIIIEQNSTIKFYHVSRMFVLQASSLLFWGKMAKACAVTVTVFLFFKKKKKKKKEMMKVGTSGEKGKFVYLLLFAYIVFLSGRKKTNIQHTHTHK